MADTYNWTFSAEEWRGIMSDFHQKVHETNKYKRVEYSHWKEWSRAFNIQVSYDKQHKRFFLTSYDSSDDYIGSYNFTVGQATSNDKQTFGDYLATYIVYIWEEEEEKTRLMVNCKNNDGGACVLSTTGETNGSNYNGYLTASDKTNFKREYESFWATADTTTVVSDKFYETKKENNKMDNKIFNFDFGPIKGDNIRMSMYGLAVKNKDGNYVAWDKANENIMNVDILNFNGDGLMYKMPVAIKDIKDGDIVIHNKVPMFVLEVFEKTLDVIDIYSGERKSIILSRSPFGFNFATKVISLIDLGAMGSDTPSEDSPFGNMWPLLMLGDSGSIDPMALAFMCGGANPMMMYALMASKGNNDNLLPLMLMMNGGKLEC